MRRGRHIEAAHRWVPDQRRKPICKPARLSTSTSTRPQQPCTTARKILRYLQFDRLRRQIISHATVTLAFLGRWRFCTDEIITGRRRDDAHLVAFEQRGAGVVDNAVARGNPLCHFDGVVEEFAHGDRLKCTRSSSVTTATCVPCSWNTNAVDGIVMHLPIDRRRELDLGVGAGPEGSVLVVDREDGDRGARAHVESAGDGQEFGGEMTIGQLRHRHVGRQAWLEEGPERLRHGDKEAQHTDVGHGKEIADRTATADRSPSLLT